MNVRVLPAGLADIDRFVALMGHAFDAHFGEAWTGAQLTGAFAAAETWGALARDNETDLGFVVTRRVVDEAELLLVAVAPGERRRGIGRTLVGEAVASARARGAKSLFLEVRESNASALALYASEGFAEVGRRRGYYLGASGARFDAVTMRRDLDDI